MTDSKVNLKTIFFGLLTSVSLATPAALGADLPIEDAACVPVLNNGNHCTSNALAIKAVSLEPDIGRCNLGETFDLNVGITFGSGRSRSAAQRSATTLAYGLEKTESPRLAVLNAPLPGCNPPQTITRYSTSPEALARSG